MNNFDLFILSCKINSGLWGSQNNSEDNLEDHIIEDYDKYCDFMFPNIKFCLNLFYDGFFKFDKNKKLEN